MIEGKQCTVAWYVDDNKISHVDKTVVTRIIGAIEAKFGKMTVTRGASHTFLGMDIDFTTHGNVKVNMRGYLEESIDESTMDIKSIAATPARKDLFVIDKNSSPLTIPRSERFHHVVAKLLYVSKRARTDIQLAVAFLCTRVSCSTEQDWKKLERLLQYLKGTLDLSLCLGADSLKKIKTWVDASYAVHGDMKSHTGGAISLGRGAIMCKLSLIHI